MDVLDDEIVDGTRFESVSDRFRGEDGEHDGDGVHDRSRQLEHDDGERDGSPRHSCNKRASKLGRKSKMDLTNLRGMTSRQSWPTRRE